MISLDVIDLIEEAENLINIGELKKASFKFHEALKLAPEDPQLYNDIGRLEMSQGNPTKAEFYFSEACRLAPDVSRYHMRLGDSLQKSYKFEEHKLSEFLFSIVLLVIYLFFFVILPSGWF